MTNTEKAINEGSNQVIVWTYSNDYMGLYDSYSEANYELANARGDKDYSDEAFEYNYFEIGNIVNNHMDESFKNMRSFNDDESEMVWDSVKMSEQIWESVLDEIVYLDDSFIEKKLNDQVKADIESVILEVFRLYCDDYVERWGFIYENTPDGEKITNPKNIHYKA